MLTFWGKNALHYGYGDKEDCCRNGAEEWENQQIRFHIANLLGRYQVYCVHSTWFFFFKKKHPGGCFRNEFYLFWRNCRKNKSDKSREKYIRVRNINVGALRMIRCCSRRWGSSTVRGNMFFSMMRNMQEQNAGTRHIPADRNSSLFMCKNLVSI